MTDNVTPANKNADKARVEKLSIVRFMISPGVLECPVGDVKEGILSLLFDARRQGKVVL
ncbi:hypothetical protein GCM10011585_22920 [Edaphobacter dinghuensis]|uniref:Uncharacterized protein n=1 Tax=Edaphobacter dinghuensis TaxID=1560005 RepID=A0A917HHJ5_9BACT|nr:hypothetical protein GCM10011585_22920 [Edaphobacter dinghuensis]